MQFFVHAWYLEFENADFCARDVNTGLSCATFSTKGSVIKYCGFMTNIHRTTSHFARVQAEGLDIDSPKSTTSARSAEQYSAQTTPKYMLLNMAFLKIPGGFTLHLELRFN